MQCVGVCTWHPRVDNSSVGSLTGTQLGAFGPIGLRPTLLNMDNQNRLGLPMPEGMFTLFPINKIILHYLKIFKI